jgi:hypothetical protein
VTIYNKNRTKVNYRRIYEQHYGPIPKELNGRSYEIHHIDGNDYNNNINNLKAVTIQEHYDIHYAQGDYYAAMLIAEKMKLSPAEISKLAKLNVKQQMVLGNHPFQDKEAQRKRALDQVANGTHPFLGGDIQRKSNLNRVANGINPIIETNKQMINSGTHPLMKRANGTSVTSDRVANGNHPWIGSSMNQKMIDSGTHPFMKKADGSSQSSDRVKNGTHNLLGSSNNLRRLESGTHPSQMKISCLCCKKTVVPGMFKRWHGDKCKQS